MTISVDLGTPAAAVTDLGAVSLSWTPPEFLAPDRDLLAALITPQPETEDWQSVLVKVEEPAPEKPATEFSDEATLFNATADAPGPVVSGDDASIELSMRFEPRARHTAAPAGGGGGSGVLGVGGSSGTGGGIGTGFGTGIGSRSGPGTGSASESGGGSAPLARAIASTGAGAKPPRAKQMERGAYPSDARRSGQEGTVTLRVEVLATGKVGAIEIAESSGFASLDQAARDAAQRWKFYPAEIEGRAVASQVRVPYTFRLVDAR